MVFGNVPGWLQAVFYATTAGFIALAAVFFSQRAQAWMGGGPDNRTGLWKERIAQLSRGLRMRTLMRDRQAGLMHSMVYFGFLVLFAGTVTLEIDHILPNHSSSSKATSISSTPHPRPGRAGLPGGLAWAFTRRYLQRPWRLRSKTKPEDGVILILLALIGVSGLTTERPASPWSVVPTSRSGLSSAIHFHL